MTFDQQWQRSFRQRMRRFADWRPGRPDETAVSIKVRVSSGCFHREHSPRAYAIIDELLSKTATTEEVGYEEHESGPELLVWIGLGTGIISLAASVVALVTAIVQARSTGGRKGDSPREPLEIVVRQIKDDREVHEEVVLRVSYKEPADRRRIGRELNKAVRRLIKDK